MDQDSWLEKPDSRPPGDEIDPNAAHKPGGDSTTGLFPAKGGNKSPRLPTIHPHQGMILQGQRLRIRLHGSLGSGGMGMVWKAETLSNQDGAPLPQTPSGSPCPPLLAVKFVSPDAAAKIEPTVVTRRELAPLLSLQGERVVPVVDWSLDLPLPFLAFEFIPNGSLDTAIRNTNGRGMSEPELLQLGYHVLTAVAGAHRSCLLHLDIKPANILLDNQGGYLLADFGLAMELMEHKRQTIPGMGTRAYQAPEQAARQVTMFDLRTDLFGVGMTLYAAATGDDYRALISQREQCVDHDFAMPPLNQRRPDLRREFCSLVMSLIQNSRRNRPGSAGEMRELIRSMIFNERLAVQTSEEFSAHRVPETLAAEIVSRLVNSAWRNLLTERPHGGVTLHYRPGESLVVEGAKTYSAFVLLSGDLEVEVEGKIVTRVTREGEIVGEVSTFTGIDRTATVRAVGDVYVIGFNPAEFEGFVSLNPMVATRLLRSLCERYLLARQEAAQLRAELSARG